MKKLAYLLSVLILLTVLCSGLTVSAAGSATITASKSTVTINDSVTITATFNGGDAGIGSLDAVLTYNSETFKYVSCTGATGNIDPNSAGRIPISYFATDAVASKTVTVTVTFTAIKAGDGGFDWKTQGVYDDDDNRLMNNNDASKALSVTASNPTLSGNANLKSLKPNKGTLTPKFNPNTTNYRVSVGNEVTSIILTAAVEQSGATHKIEGSTTLKVGQNTFTITVTAPNGTTKKYTVVVTRAEAPSSTTGTTQPPPAEDALDVEVDGVMMTIQDTQTAALPDGFSWSSVTINRVEVPAAVNEQGLTLLYLMAQDHSDEGFFIYNAEADSFVRYRPFTTQGGTWLLYDAPHDKTFTGTVRGELNYDGGTVGAYVYEDPDMSDFYIVWAKPTEGDAGWYTYDAKEGTLQRYHTVAGEIIEVRPTTTTTKKPQRTTAKKADNGAGIGKFFQNNTQVLLIGAIVLAGAVIVIIAVMILVALGGRRKGKH